MNRLPGARLRTGGQVASVSCATALFAAATAVGFDRQLTLAMCLRSALLSHPLGHRANCRLDYRASPSRADLIVGTGDTARRVWELSVRHRECAFEVSGSSTTGR